MVSFTADCSEAITALEKLLEWSRGSGGQLPRDIQHSLVAGDSLFVGVISGGAVGANKATIVHKPNKELARWLAARPASDMGVEVVG
jgi:hypothetical protein